MSFSYLFRSEWKWIIYFPTMYVYCIYRVISKSSKKLSNCLKRAETSVVLIVFDCVLYEVYEVYKLISMNAVTVSYRRSTWIRYQKKISWSEAKYKCITTNIRSIRCDYSNRTSAGLKKTLTGQRRNTIKTSYVSILRLSSFYLYKLQTIWLLHLYYIVSAIQMFVYLYVQHSLTSICYTSNFLYRWILSV
jgi:hypothetical protein